MSIVALRHGPVVLFINIVSNILQVIFFTTNKRWRLDTHSWNGMRVNTILWERVFIRGAH
jgi:hypothetical protein